jgi:hypothetical protein
MSHALGHGADSKAVDDGLFSEDSGALVAERIAFRRAFSRLMIEITKRPSDAADMTNKETQT